MKPIKIQYVKVNDTDDYFALPKKDREYYGFYRLPYALPCDFFDEGVKGWDAFYEEIKKRYPVQYFFRRWLFSFDNPIYKIYSSWIKWPIRDFYYASKRFFDPFFPRWRKTLARHEYTDATELLVKSNFNLILDFYYDEVVNGCVDWESDEKHSEFLKRLKEAVDWIENGQQKLEDKMNEELSIATKNKKEKDYHKKYKKYNKMEKQLFDTQTKILTWAIENRGFFWS